MENLPRSVKVLSTEKEVERVIKIMGTVILLEWLTRGIL